MSIYCVYLTTYCGSKLPPFYIGSSSIEKVKKGYRGSVSSADYKKIWESELKHNPALFKTKIIYTCSSRDEATNKELKLQEKLQVVSNPLYINKGYARRGFFFNGKHTTTAKLKISNFSKANSKTRNTAPAFNNDQQYLGLVSTSDPRWGIEIHGYNYFSDTISEKISARNKQQVIDQSHPWLGDKNPSRIKVSQQTHHFLSGSNIRKRIDDFQRELVKSGKHHWKSDEHKQKTSANTQKRIKNGSHPFAEKVKCPHCGKIGQKAGMIRYHFTNCKTLRSSHVP